MVHDESLDVLSVVNELSKPVVNLIKNLLPDGIVAPGKVVRRILLPVQKKLGVEHRLISAISDIVHHTRLQVDRYLARHELSGTGLLEEGGKVQVLSFQFNLQRAVRIDFVLRGILTPYGIPKLNSGLPN